jgi:hypothetical protein
VEVYLAISRCLARSPGVMFSKGIFSYQAGAHHSGEDAAAHFHCLWKWSEGEGVMTS